MGGSENAVRLTRHDDPAAADVAVVSEGLERANQGASSVDATRPVACFARDATLVIGGAVGRRWGAACELQMLWVDESRRGRGLGSALLDAFEAAAQSHHCETILLETFCFQAPGFYLRRGYEERLALDIYPDGVVKYVLVKSLGSDSRQRPL